MEKVETLLYKKDLNADDLATLLSCTGEEERSLYARSKEVRDNTLGNGVYMRGLIEISNRCIKDCLYCGIRRSNSQAKRYALSEENILDAAAFAHRYRYGSVVLQGGERKDEAFIAGIEQVVRKIKQLSEGTLGITLSLGEQNEDTYRRWREAGAHRLRHIQAGFLFRRVLRLSARAHGLTSLVGRTGRGAAYGSLLRVALLCGHPDFWRRFAASPRFGSLLWHVRLYTLAHLLPVRHFAGYHSRGRRCCGAGVALQKSH